MNNIFFHECQTREQMKYLWEQDGVPKQADGKNRAEGRKYLVTMQSTYVHLKCLNRWKDAVDLGLICDYAVKDCLFNSFHVDSFAFQCISGVLRSKIVLVQS